MTELTLHPPAKLNLYLKVVGRRDDGYHLLDSLFCTIGLYDRLTLSLAGEITFGCNREALSGDNNLVVRAAQALRAAAGVKDGVRLYLDKQIPHGAGLGGGSSDAASTLLGLNKLWGLDWPLDPLARLGESLGSDVPFFIYGGACRVRGRGERVESVGPMPKGWCVLLNPGVHLATEAVFRAFARQSDSQLLTGSGPDSIITTADLESQDKRWAAVGNDLQPVAEKLAPEIGAAVQSLQRAGGAHVRMSGSGSSVFCLALTEAAANAIADRLQRTSANIWVVPLVDVASFSG